MMVVNNNELTRARLEFRESEGGYAVHHLREEEARDANRSRAILEVKGPFRKSKVNSFEYEHILNDVSLSSEKPKYFTG